MTYIQYQSEIKRFIKLKNNILHLLHIKVSILMERFIFLRNMLWDYEVKFIEEMTLLFHTVTYTQLVCKLNPLQAK